MVVSEWFCVVWPLRNRRFACGFVVVSGVLIIVLFDAVEVVVSADGDTEECVVTIWGDVVSELGLGCSLGCRLYEVSIPFYSYRQDGLSVWSVSTLPV